MTNLDDRSIKLLESAHPDLVKVIKRAAAMSPVVFVVTETVRTLDKQKALYATGASKTMRSRHLPNADGLSCAADVAAKVGGVIRWDWPLYQIISDNMKEAARIEGIPIEWGGDWRDFKDGPHYQLPWALYP